MRIGSLYFHPNYLNISGLLIFALCFLTAYIVRKNTRRPDIFSWLLFGLFIGLWGVGIFCAFTFKSKTEVLFWARFLNLVAIFIPIFFLQFVFNYLNIQKRAILKFFFAITTVYFCICLLLPAYFVSDVKPAAWFSLYPVAGPLYFFFPLQFSALVCFGLFLLYKAYLERDDLPKDQMRLLFGSMILGFTGGATTFPLVFGIKLYPIGVIAPSLLALTVAYSITKHQLFNMKVAVSKTLAFTITFCLFSVITIGLQFSLWQTHILDNLFSQTIFSILLLGIFAFAFDPIRTHLQTQTDRLILPIETAEKLANEAAFGAASKSFAHEILNQMSMIQLGSPAVGHEDPAIAKKFGDMVLSCVTRLHHLSEIMLYGNKGQAEQTSITVHALFTNVAELLIAQTRMLQIEVAIDCPQTLSFKGNESEWFQVFLNLALNAIQAIKEAREADPERPTDTLQFRATQKNDTLELSIQDSGPGMSPEVQAKLFSQSFTSKATGHGLGMAFVGKVVASSGGRISVASEMGRGTGIVIKIKAL